MAFEGLSAKIDADASDYTSTMGVAKELTDELGDEALDVSAAMLVMSSRTDEAADEAGELARNAGAASAAMGGMGAASVGASNGLNLVSVSSAGLQVSLGPLIVLLSALIVALLGVLSAGIAIAGLGALLLGSGLLVFGQQAAERFSDAESAAEGLAQVASNLQSQIIPILRPLGRAFAPLIGQAADAIPSLVRDIVSAVGPLNAFKRGARALGSAIAEVLPLIIRLGSEAFRDLSQELALAGGELIRLLPPLVRFGVRVLKFLIPALVILSTVLRGVLTVTNALLDIILGGIDIVVGLGSAINDILVGALINAVNASDKLIGRLSQLLGLMLKLQGLPGGQNLIAAGGAVAASGAGATARRTPSTGRRNEARRGNPQGRRGGDLPNIRVEGDTGVVKDVAFEGGQEGARTELERERRRTGDRR